LAGHLLQHEGILKTIIEGRIERERIKEESLDLYIYKANMKDVCCTAYVEMKRTAERSPEWRTVAKQSSDW
jgi:hypothetical protein